MTRTALVQTAIVHPRSREFLIVNTATLKKRRKIEREKESFVGLYQGLDALRVGKLEELSLSHIRETLESVICFFFTPISDLFMYVNTFICGAIMSKCIAC